MFYLKEKINIYYMLIILIYQVSLIYCNSVSNYGIEGQSTFKDNSSRVARDSIINDHHICLISPTCDVTNTYSLASSRLPCVCDASCSYYGDCCLDPPKQTDITLLFPSSVNPSPELWTCKELYSQTSHIYQTVFMVGWCPEGTPRHLDERCQQRLHKGSVYSHLMDIPVISSDHSIIFSNIYCAKCHHQKLFYEYAYSIDCENSISSTKELHKMKYQKKERMWEDDNGMNECHVNIDYPQGVGRWCEPHIITQCKNGSQCSSVNYHLADINTKSIYKNYECAICNNIGESDLNCPSSLLRTPVLRNLPPSLTDLFKDNVDCISEFDSVVYDQILHRNENIYCGFEKHLEYDSCVDDGISAINIVSTVLVSISLICMALHNILFLILPKRRNPPNFDTFSMTTSLFIAELFFMTSFNATDNHNACYFLTLVIYYFFMCSFTWMTIIGSSLFKTFSSAFQRHKQNTKAMVTHSLIGWGGPILLVIITVIVDQTTPADSSINPKLATCRCWFNSKWGLFTFFNVPTEVMMLTNIVLFILTSQAIRKTQRESKVASSANNKQRKSRISIMETAYNNRESQVPEEEEDTGMINQTKKNIKEFYESSAEQRERLRLNTKLALIMGLTWTFQCFSNLVRSETIDYIFVILNGLQGTMIFILFDCKRTVLQDLRKEVCKKLNRDYIPSTTKSYSTTSSAL